MKKLQKFFTKKIDLILVKNGEAYTIDRYSGSVKVCACDTLEKNGFYRPDGIEIENCNTQLSEYLERFSSTSRKVISSVKVEKNVLKKLLLSASDDCTRLHLTTVFFDAENSCIVTTNGYTMQTVEKKFPKEFSNVLIHRQDLLAIVKVAKKNELVEISILSDGRLDISCENHLVNCAVVFRDYPRYQSVIPTEQRLKNSLRISTDLLTWLKAALPLLKKEKVRRVDFEPGKATISALPNYPTFHSDCTGEISFNIEYFLDIFEIGEVKFLHSMNPALQEKESRKLIVMPMKK